MQKPTVFRVDFPIFTVGAAICRPPERVSVPIKNIRTTRGINSRRSRVANGSYGNLLPAKRPEIETRTGINACFHLEFIYEIYENLKSILDFHKIFVLSIDTAVKLMII